MSNRELWVEKKFEFGFPAEGYLDLLETLAAAPERLAGLLDGMLSGELTSSRERSWSIQENAGHLTTVEDLFVGRLDDYDNGAKELRAADMSNRKTGQARHNDADIAEIIAGFRDVRGSYV